jgi:hypothetical protein
MDDFCIFKLELSIQNDNPDIPNYTPNVNKLYSVSEMLPIKYERYEIEQSRKQPLKIIISASPISSSPAFYRIDAYLNKRKFSKGITGSTRK